MGNKADFPLVVELRLYFPLLCQLVSTFIYDFNTFSIWSSIFMLPEALHFYREMRKLYDIANDVLSTLLW